MQRPLTAALHACRRSPALCAAAAPAFKVLALCAPATILVAPPAYSLVTSNARGHACHLHRPSDRRPCGSVSCPRLPAPDPGLPCHETPGDRAAQVSGAAWLWATLLPVGPCSHSPPDALPTRAPHDCRPAKIARRPLRTGELPPTRRLRRLERAQLCVAAELFASPPCLASRSAGQTSSMHCLCSDSTQALSRCLLPALICSRCQRACGRHRRRQAQQGCAAGRGLRCLRRAAGQGPGAADLRPGEAAGLVGAGPAGPDPVGGC